MRILRILRASFAEGARTRFVIADDRELELTASIDWSAFESALHDDAVGRPLALSASDIAMS